MITKEFNAMSNKISREEEYDEEDESVTYIYDCSSLLQFMCSIKSKINLTIRESNSFLFQHEIIKTNKYSVLRNKFAFLNNPDNIMGN
jgi:hypothetical protein